MELKRVVITGLGAITPIGKNVTDYWAALLEGVSGAAPITNFEFAIRAIDSLFQVMRVISIPQHPFVIVAL